MERRHERGQDHRADRPRRRYVRPQADRSARRGLRSRRGILHGRMGRGTDGHPGRNGRGHGRSDHRGHDLHLHLFVRGNGNLPGDVQGGQRRLGRRRDKGGQDRNPWRGSDAEPGRYPGCGRQSRRRVRNGRMDRGTAAGAGDRGEYDLYLRLRTGWHRGRTCRRTGGRAGRKACGGYRGRVCRRTCRRTH